MYNISDRNEVVREIKKYLYLISTTTREEIGRTTIDSFYDEATAEIIRSYQRATGINESGIVVFIGDKEGYGNTIIVQRIDGIDEWYGGIVNTNLKLSINSPL